METSNELLYTVYAISDGIRYNLTPALISLEREDAEGQIAQKVVLKLLNVKVESITLASILKARDRVFIYANDGTKTEDNL